MFTKLLFPAFENCTRKIFQLNSTKLNCLQVFPAPNVETVRYAARRGTRAAKNAKKKARKLANQNKPKPIPAYLQRKVKISAELERRRCVDENWLEAQPIDDVYNMKLYRGKPYSLSEAIQMHREAHVPSLINHPSSLIYANVELDLKLKKKEKYLENINGVLTYSNKFQTHRENRIIVICKNADDQLKASEAGAVNVGSTTLIKQILAGTVSKEDFDYVICHPDMLKELNVLRGILTRKFPNANNGLLRLDVDNAVNDFKYAVSYELKRSVLEPDFGWVDVPFGRLDMPLGDLEQNLKDLLESVEKQKPSGTDHILFVIRTLICTEYSREKFKIAHWNYLSNYPEHGVLIEEEEEIQMAEKKKETQ